MLDSNLDERRQDLFQTSAGVGHQYRPGYYFPSSNFKVCWFFRFISLFFSMFALLARLYRSFAPSASISRWNHTSRAFQNNTGCFSRQQISSAGSLQRSNKYAQKSTGSVERWLTQPPYLFFITRLFLQWTTWAISWRNSKLTVGVVHWRWDIRRVSTRKNSRADPTWKLKSIASMVNYLILLNRMRLSQR